MRLGSRGRQFDWSQVMRRSVNRRPLLTPLIPISDVRHGSHTSTLTKADNNLSIAQNIL